MKHKFAVHQIKKDLKGTTCKEFAKGYYTIESLNETIVMLQKIYECYIASENMSLEGLRKYKKKVIHNKK
ncbi:MAG: hypothetical protein KAG14_00060 [Mycoplasmataceae bacterium]|nr:hypothetical protein [Mycoplasmataceae bacterium]